MTALARSALLDRIARERVVAAAIPGLPRRWRARAAIAVEAGQLPKELGEASDRALHAIAATTLAQLSADGPGEERVARLAIRSWMALADRAEYVALASTNGSHIARVGLDRVTSALHARARGGGELGPLLRALDEVRGNELVAVAARARRDAIDLVTDPLRRALDELATRRPTADELCAAFDAVVVAWRRSDGDVDLEVLVVERLGDFAWDLYRDRALADLERLLRTVSEPCASLASRIERAEASAWAAPCAQVLVFQAELASRFDTQVALAERAFLLCPSLRNARVVLADFLVTRAERAIDRGAQTTSHGTRAEDDVARAASIHPELKRLAGVQAKLDRSRRAR